MKKLNFKLTAFGVSLFVAFILLIVGKNNKYCQFFAFVLLGVGLVILALYLSGYNAKKALLVEDELDVLEEIEDLTDEEMAYYTALCVQLKKLKSKRTQILFYITAAFMVAVGILLLIS